MPYRTQIPTRGRWNWQSLLVATSMLVRNINRVHPCASTTQTALLSTTCSNCRDLTTHLHSSNFEPLKMMSFDQEFVLTGILTPGKSHDNHLEEIYSVCTSGYLQAGSIVLPAGTLSCRHALFC